MRFLGLPKNCGLLASTFLVLGNHRRLRPLLTLTQAASTRQLSKTLGRLLFIFNQCFIDAFIASEQPVFLWVAFFFG